MENIFIFELYYRRKKKNPTKYEGVEEKAATHRINDDILTGTHCVIENGMCFLCVLHQGSCVNITNDGCSVANLWKFFFLFP